MAAIYVGVIQARRWRNDTCTVPGWNDHLLHMKKISRGSKTWKISSPANLHQSLNILKQTSGKRKLFLDKRLKASQDSKRMHEKRKDVGVKGLGLNLFKSENTENSY